MRPRQTVLLTAARSSVRPQLLSCKRPASVTHLGSTLLQHRARRSHLLSTLNPSLCSLTLTKCKFSNSFVLTFIQNAGGVGGRAPASLIELSTSSSIYPLLFHALAHSFSQRALHNSFGINSLRTLSVATDVYTPQALFLFVTSLCLPPYIFTSLLRSSHCLPSACRWNRRKGFQIAPPSRWASEPG